MQHLHYGTHRFEISDLSADLVRQACADLVEDPGTPIRLDLRNGRERLELLLTPGIPIAIRTTPPPASPISG